MAVNQEICDFNKTALYRYANRNDGNTTEDWDEYNQMLFCRGISPYEAIKRSIGILAPRGEKTVIADAGANDVHAFTGYFVASKLYSQTGQKTSRGLYDYLKADGLLDMTSLYAFSGPPDQGNVAKSLDIKYLSGNLFSDFPTFIPPQGVDILLARHTLYQSNFDLAAFELAMQCLKVPNTTQGGGMLFTRRALNSGFDENLIYTHNEKQVPILMFLRFLKDLLNYEIEYKDEGDTISISALRHKGFVGFPIRLKRIVKEQLMPNLSQSAEYRPEYVLDSEFEALVAQSGIKWEESDWFKRIGGNAGRSIVNVVASY